jgi:CO/xanthine dehydrogenase Mo-binding subunit
MLFDWPVLAFDRVIFAGQRVVAVAAETRDAAEEAVNLVEVEYEDLPAIIDAEDALTPDAPVLHPDHASYVYLEGVRPPLPHPNLQSYKLIQKGDPEIERAFAQADRVFEDVYTGPRQHQGYIEPHACVVWIDSDGVVQVFSTNKAPYRFRGQLSIVSGVPEQNIVVDSRFIGGDFGGKGNSIDEFACYFLARATGRPVKSVMTYAEELSSTNPRHAARIYVRTGVMDDGRLVAFESRAFYNGGACGGAKPAAGLSMATGFSTMQAYNVPNTRMEVFVSYTNTIPCGNMRAPGAPIAALAGEEQLDHIARELGIDPIELRLKNALREGDRGPSNELIRNPRPVEVLETLRREVNWRALPPNHGRGIALRHREGGEGKTEIVLRLLPSGRIEALYGTPDQGSGSATLVRRIAAAVLSVNPAHIDVRYGTTGQAPVDPGAGASRVTHVMGKATIAGATELKARLEELAAEVMGWPAGQVRLEGSEFRASGADSGGVELQASFEEVARRIAAGPPVEVVGAYDSHAQHNEAEDTSFYAYMIEVAVDPETGEVRPLDAVVVVDVGPIINPIAFQGQLDGSFVYGIGNTLMEDLEIDEEGRITTLSLGEYKLPTQVDIPPVRTILLPTEIGPGPFGAKAVGETTNSGVHPAISNAVRDAVGVRIKTYPVTAERVHEALQSSG